MFVIMQCEVKGGQVYLYLQDASGVFLELEPDPEASVHGAEKEMETGEEESDEEVETLKQALNEAKENNATLATEVSLLRKGLQKQKDRVKELWKLNCAQLWKMTALLHCS